MGFSGWALPDLHRPARSASVECNRSCHPCALLRLKLLLCACLLIPRAAMAQATAPPEPPINDEYRITAFPTHPLFGDFVGFGYLGYVDAVDKNTKTYYLGWPGVIYKPRQAGWIEGWAGFIYVWNDIENASNTHELRPFVGVKLYVPNSAHVNVYNLTRYEWRNVTTDETGTT